MSTATPPTADAQPIGGISTPRLIFRLVLIVAIVVALSIVMKPHWVRVMAWGLADNDDAMRVLEVRDWLHGQGWFDLSQHRLNPPQGGDMHWSRIADLPLAALMAPLMAFFGAEMGAKYAAFWTPILLGVVYVWVGARTAASLGGKSAFIPGILLVACAPAALSYFLPGRVDHHGLQMILIACALWGLITDTPRSAAWAGFAISMGICIGLEALPLQIVLIGWVALRWGLRGTDVRQQTIGFSLGFGISLLSLFVLNVAPEKWALPVNDAVGRGYVVLGLLGGALLSAAAYWLKSASVIARFVALTAIGLIVGLGILAFPEIIVPPYGKVDPLLTRLWLNNVNETEPLITSKKSILLSFALFPIFSAVAALIAVCLTKDKKRDLWILAALTIIVAGALAIFWQSRMAGLATAVSSIIAAAMVAEALHRFNWKVALGLAVVVNPVLPGLGGAAIANLFEPKSTRYATGGGQGCFTQASFGALSQAPIGLVVAPIDMGARILLTTNHKVLAAPYHRNNVGNLAAYQLFLLPQKEAQARATALGVRYIAICKRSAEVAILSRERPSGLMSDLGKGTIPAWLEPLATPKGSDVIAYQIKTP
jgi:asparagine N-glycosylation enzyme membrane subunit Stt3